MLRLLILWSNFFEIPKFLKSQIPILNWSLGFFMVLTAFCHSEERRITLEIPYRMSPIFVDLLL